MLPFRFLKVTCELFLSCEGLNRSKSMFLIVFHCYSVGKDTKVS